MKQFVRGQKSSLKDITASTELTVRVSVAAKMSGMVFDISCFGVDAADKLSDDRYFIFFNQKVSPCGSLAALGGQGAGQENFQVNLDKIPSLIRKLVFTVTVDGAETMSQISQGQLRILDKNAEVAGFEFSGSDFKDEKAIIIGEIYLKDIWRFAAVGQGFNGGLSALLKHFGGEEIVEEPSPNIKPDIPKPPTTVNLNKSGDSHKVNLAKDSQELLVHVNLNWDAKSGGGFFGKGVEKPDLDLGCMYQTADGEIGVIQPLGGNFGSKTAKPFIFLDKDDRSGAASDGENMYLYKPSTLKRVMFFALIYQGANDFRSVSGRMFFKIGNGDLVTLELNNPSSNTRLCAAALITNQNQQIAISKEERYFAGHQQADAFYGFGFTWKAGSK